jgi:hypothetical protein
MVGVRGLGRKRGWTMEGMRAGVGRAEIGERPIRRRARLRRVRRWRGEGDVVRLGVIVLLMERGRETREAESLTSGGFVGGGRGVWAEGGGKVKLRGLGGEVVFGHASKGRGVVVKLKRERRGRAKANINSGSFKARLIRAVSRDRRDALMKMGDGKGMIVRGSEPKGCEGGRDCWEQARGNRYGGKGENKKARSGIGLLGSKEDRREPELTYPPSWPPTPDAPQHHSLWVGWLSR